MKKSIWIFGIGLVASVFGSRLEVVENNPPWVHPVAEGENETQKSIEATLDGLDVSTSHRLGWIPRVEETIQFAQKNGYRRLGLAFCVGLANEARTLTLILERKGFEVVFAQDGSIAVDLAGSEKPELILMDMSLPVMDGWEATRRIKADSETKDIPVIALTAHAMAGDREKAIEAGCEDYDTKPVDFPRLMRKIEALIGG